MATGMWTDNVYIPAENRYEQMHYRKCGRSGIKLPVISLGLWHNFGGYDSYENARAVIRKAFDLGIVHFDLANNYGPPYGSAEQTFGRILHDDLMPYRDELFISTKAGYDMWKGPYGDGGSRKYLISSLDQSLKRMEIDYVDVFYHHCMDSETPLEETMGALAHIVKSGKALYVGLSNYDADTLHRGEKLLSELGVHCLIHQPRYSMLSREIEENGVLDTLSEKGIGCICFSALAQGILSGKYGKGSIPTDSRAAGRSHFLTPSDLNQSLLEKVVQLEQIASERGQSLPQMALAWVLRQPAVTTALIGARTVEQLIENAGAVNNLNFSKEELQHIEKVITL